MAAPLGYTKQGWLVVLHLVDFIVHASLPHGLNFNIKLPMYRLPGIFHKITNAPV